MEMIRVLGPPSAHLPGSAVFLRKLPMQLCAYPVTVYFVVSVLATGRRTDWRKVCKARFYGLSVCKVVWAELLQLKAVKI